MSIPQKGGKTVRVFMADGVPSGLLIAEIINWTGRVYVCPRPALVNLSQRDDLSRTGVYILSGPSEDSLNKEKIYIGESDNVLKRIIQHDKDEEKDFWKKAIFIISKDENLTKSHIRYLESRLIEISKNANQAELANNTAPETKLLPE
ncbi:MAG: GIY-YIG nuclease family protein, partial [Nitrospinaceae bacterium]